METSASFEARYAPLLYPTNQLVLARFHFSNKRLSGIDRLTAKWRRHAFAGQREQPQLKRFLPSACYFFKRGNAQKEADNNKSGRDVCASRLRIFV
jgi:hypothetical protein